MKLTVKRVRGWMAVPAISMMLVLAASLPLASGARAADASAQLGPQELVTKVAQDTLKDLDAHRAEYKQNPKRVRELVDKNMLPHFDTQYAAQLVLAKYWRTATPEQRKRFVEAFYQSLLQNYGEALLEFTPDRLKILPFQGNKDDKVATVRSEVRREMVSACPSTIRCARRTRAGRRTTCRSKACRT
jgi:phospholipid transport system substrate-binding protein